MKEEGIVIEVKKETATIEIKPHGECHKCRTCGVIRAGKMTVNGEDAAGLKVGDHVEVEMDSSTMLKVYTLLYGAPLAVFVVIILFLYELLNSPLLSFAGALVATAGVYVASGIFTRKNPAFFPHVTKKS